jgi:ERCC4-type nuclease
MLEDKNAPIKREFLEVGDHLLPNSFASERKTGRDLLNSISDKRLYKQLSNLCQFDYPILSVVTEDIWKDLYFARNQRNQNIHSTYQGTLNTIYAKFPKIRVIFFDSDEEYVDWLIEMDEKLTNGEKGVRPTPLTRKATSVHEVRENVLAAIPGVGISTAKKLLKKYNTINNISNADENDLTSIEKLGKTTAKKIIEVLN